MPIIFISSGEPALQTDIRSQRLELFRFERRLHNEAERVESTLL